MKHALTIDVEDYFQVAAFNDVISPANWDEFESRVEANTHRFMALTERQGVKATFFILGWIAERHPQLVRDIAAAGHEVASHGYSHQLIYRQTPAEFHQETERSRKLLQDLSQQPVDGYRAASYSVTPDSLWALDIIAGLGFNYDSSIYPIHHDNYGLQGGPEQPYLIELPNGQTLREFPITTARMGSLAVPVGGGGYFRLYPYPVTTWLLRRRLAQINAPFVFYLHPWELDPEQPRVAGSRLLSRFRHYNNLKQVEQRLERLLGEFEFGTMQACLAQLSSFQTHRYH